MAYQQNNISLQEYYCALEIEELQRIKSQLETEISGLGEMSESASNGAEWMRYGPNAYDCEIEIESSKYHLGLVKNAIEEKEQHNAKTENNDSQTS
jgi:hypothetical protein